MENCGRTGSGGIGEAGMQQATAPPLIRKGERCGSVPDGAGAAAPADDPLVRLAGAGTSIHWV